MDAVLPPSQMVFFVWEACIGIWGCIFGIWSGTQSVATAHTHVARQTSPRKALNVFGGAYLVFRGMHFLFDIWGCIFGIWSGSQSVASSHTPRNS